MKTNTDVAAGWIRKAKGDLRAMALTLRPGALEACCFHAQQAVDKSLKGYLVAKDRDFPFTHDLEKIIDIATKEDPAFLLHCNAAKIPTPYAVELRYDQQRDVTMESAREASKMARDIFRFIQDRLPAAVSGPRSRQS